MISVYCKCFEAEKFSNNFLKLKQTFLMSTNIFLIFKLFTWKCSNIFICPKFFRLIPYSYTLSIINYIFKGPGARIQSFLPCRSWEQSRFSANNTVLCITGAVCFYQNKNPHTDSKNVSIPKLKIIHKKLWWKNSFWN